VLERGEDEASSAWLVRNLEEKGVLVVPVPRYIARLDRTAPKACQQYSLPDFYDNIVLLDTGHAKLMAHSSPWIVLG